MGGMPIEIGEHAGQQTDHRITLILQALKNTEAGRFFLTYISRRAKSA
jgi:hypothetical protein